MPPVTIPSFDIPLPALAFIGFLILLAAVLCRR